MSYKCIAKIFCDKVIACVLLKPVVISFVLHQGNFKVEFLSIFKLLTLVFFTYQDKDFQPYCNEISYIKRTSIFVIKQRLPFLQETLRIPLYRRIKQLVASVNMLFGYISQVVETRPNDTRPNLYRNEVLFKYFITCIVIIVKITIVKTLICK